ncbi:MAG TPA: HIT domain-containing protein [Thermoanaerobaculales bacterium]|nr:HIT domain-containing protein [Thermoanaerobaculales bacterium]
MGSYDRLHEFIAERMRMSHIYQPVMLRVLLENGGRASKTAIAKAFVEQDRSQIEYYETIVHNMPGRVLRSHGIVEKVGDDYQLTQDFRDLSDDDRQSLIAECEKKLCEYLEVRGIAPWQHRRKHRGYISGSLRYEIIRRARGRCEACGVSSLERQLQVDHIVPKNVGGSDDPANMQALCETCNSQKSDRDDTDFAAVHASYSHRQAGCPFCDPPRGRVVAETELALAVRDGYPATEGHTLIVPRRHVADYFDLYQPEKNAIDRLLAECRRRLESADSSISGFNVGVNSGESAGQTIFHAHVHLIPRRAGDVASPRGGVRGVIPAKQSY